MLEIKKGGEDMEKNLLQLPPEDAKILMRYAMWNPEIDPGKGKLCKPCSHCSPDVEPEPRPNKIPRYLRGECHCHPCGSCGRI